MALGYVPITRYLAQARHNGMLSHAYALVGKNQLGKRTLAREFAAELLQTEPSKLKTNPDFTYVTRLVDEKTGKLKKDITVAQARELKNSLERSSWNAGWRVCIIDEAEFLNDEAGNALLKLLEEPPEKSLIFLLLENDYALLPTIRSRVQMLYLAPLTDQALAAELVQAGNQEKDISVVVPLAYGRPGRAIELLNNPDERAAESQEKTRWQELQHKPFFTQVALLEDLFAKTETEERAQEKISAVLDSWSLWWRQEMLSPGTPRSSGVNARATEIAATIDALQTSKVFLREQVNPRLVVENVIQHF